MIDISEKKSILRIATASGKIYLKRETIKRIKNKKVKKGEVLTIAKIAALTKGFCLTNDNFLRYSVFSFLDKFVISLPKYLISPCVGDSSNPKILNKVVFPLPFGPIIVKVSPLLIEKLMFDSTEITLPSFL
ncbi:Cyclic pyranopterin monophosphate synthase [subsurface metagenome]